MPKVFISYSHKDEAWKDRLVTHLGVLDQQGLLEIWEDRQITGGEDWFPAIKNALSACDIALLLVTANFLTSKFILTEEVPQLLQRRQRDGVLVIPLIVKPCAWKKVAWLKSLQARPKDGRALCGGNDHQIDTDLTNLAEEIAELINRVERVKPVPVPTVETPKPEPKPVPWPLIGRVVLIALLGSLAYTVFTKEAPALLSIVTAPADATVLLDGKKIDQSQRSKYPTSAGKMRLRVEKPPYYITLDTTISFIAGKETKLDLKLKPALARVTIQVQPADAEVILGGEALAASKRKNLALSLGAHSLNLSRAGYKSKLVQFRVTTPRDTTLSYTLDSEVVVESGTIRLQASLDGRVYIDGDFKGNIANGETREYDQPVGSYLVELRGANETVSQMANVTRSKATTVTLRPKPALRSTRRNDLTEGEVKSMLVAKGLFDSAWNKSADGFKNEYELRTIAGTQVVVDKAAGVLWQRGGSPDSMTYANAEKYLSDLNSGIAGAGDANWRFPTLEEVMSLMESNKLNSALYIDPVFDKTQRWIWTVDKDNSGRVWVVFFDHGYCDYNGVRNLNFVRAVRSEK